MVIGKTFCGPIKAQYSRHKGLHPHFNDSYSTKGLRAAHHLEALRSYSEMPNCMDGLAGVNEHVGKSIPIFWHLPTNQPYEDLKRKFQGFLCSCRKQRLLQQEKHALKLFRSMGIMVADLWEPPSRTF